MRLMQSLPDDELLNRFFAGQLIAFDVLAARYQKDVRTVVMRYAKDRWLAEDLLQESLLKIYTSLMGGKYSHAGKFKPWALRLARNLCLDHLRKTAQQPPCKAIFSFDEPCSSLQSNAEQKLISQQRDAQVNACINRLPLDQRRVVCYRYFEDLSFKEIASLMNTSVNTSLGRMRYGMAQLRKQMLGKDVWN